MSLHGETFQRAVARLGYERLGVVQPDRCASEIRIWPVRECRQEAEPREGHGVLRLGVAQQVFRLPLEVIEIRTFR